MKNQIKIPIQDVIKITDKIMKMFPEEKNSIKVLMGLKLAVEFLNYQMDITEEQDEELKIQMTALLNDVECHPDKMGVGS